MTSVASPSSGGRLEQQPLYAKVRELLVQRLIGGVWKPGEMIPSEFAIADELGVSQGTVRKSLDEMTSAGLLVRKQGRGTFVSEAEDKSILFRFFRLTSDSYEDIETLAFPTSRYLDRQHRTANEQERSTLGLSHNAKVLVYERLRSNLTGPMLWERLVLPFARFPGLDSDAELPNNVYHLYSRRFGIMVERVEEKLKAVIADEDIAGYLELPHGSPLLQIDRCAFALDGSVVEWRVSQCRSDTMHYRNAL